MSHIHTGPGQHDHTASIYLFRTDSNEPKIILHLHKKLGKYMQFGGHVELTETPWQTIAHELREESGYELGQISILQPRARLQTLKDAVLHPQPIAHSTHAFGGNTDHFHTDVAYAGATIELSKNSPEEGESTNIRQLTRAELIALPATDIPDNVRQIALFVFDECLPNWQPVPATSFN